MSNECDNGTMGISFKNNLVISWRSVLLAVESRENRRTAAS